MKTRNVYAAGLGALLTLSALGARSAEMAAPAAVKANVPQTAAAKASAELISRAERAFNGFVAACASGASNALSTVTLRDLRLETQLDEPGAYSRLEQRSVAARCKAVGGRGAQISNLWIYPTSDATSVFVQYTVGVPGMAGQPQLALMEMQGERIARMVSFANPPSDRTLGAATPARKQAKDDPS